MKITATHLLVITIIFLRWSMFCLAISPQSFYYPYFSNAISGSLSDLRYIGSAHNDDERQVMLLTEHMVLTDERVSYGGMVRVTPIEMYDVKVNKLNRSEEYAIGVAATFSMSFQIKLSLLYNDPDMFDKPWGMLFFLSETPDVVKRNYGLHFGVFPADGSPTSQNVFGIEFDTFLDVNVSDLDNNHIGINLNSARSIVTCAMSELGIELEGTQLTVWLQYFDYKKQLTLYLSLNDQKPSTPILTMDNTDIRDLVEKQMYAGFSAVGSSAVQEKALYYWTMESYNFSNPPPPTPSRPPPPSPPLSLWERIKAFSWLIAVKVAFFSFLIGPTIELGVLCVILRFTECGQRKLVWMYTKLDKLVETRSIRFPGIRRIWNCICGLWICIVCCTIPRIPQKTAEELAQQREDDLKRLKCDKCFGKKGMKVEATTTKALETNVKENLESEAHAKLDTESKGKPKGEAREKTKVQKIAKAKVEEKSNVKVEAKLK